MRKILIYTCERCGIEYEARRKEWKREKSRQHGQSLAQVAAEARAHGMTYGQWVALRRGNHGH